ncbi:unnamed protein product [Oreochromis niloticus]|nr:unnamed protein product [Mustela putorius furo]
MEEKDKDYPELSDIKWIMDLAFLVDMLCHLDRLNLTLQGKLKMLPDLVQSVFAFVNKLKLFKTHIQKGDLTHFPTLLKASGQVASAALSKQRARYATLIENFHESFVTQFHDLQLNRPQITFLIDPFNAETGCLKVPLVTGEAVAELEMIDLCEEDQLKPALREGTIEFWKSVPMKKYPNVKRAALKILSMFGSTYVCKEFPTLKIFLIQPTPANNCGCSRQPITLWLTEKKKTSLTDLNVTACLSYTLLISSLRFSFASEHFTCCSRQPTCA